MLANGPQLQLYHLYLHSPSPLAKLVHPSALMLARSLPPSVSLSLSLPVSVSLPPKNYKTVKYKLNSS